MLPKQSRRTVGAEILRHMEQRLVELVARITELRRELVEEKLMARNQLPQIKKIQVLDRHSGKKVVRYQLVADAGVDPITGQRGRIRHRFKTEREAREELGKLTHRLSTDSFVLRNTEIPRSRGDVGAKRLFMPNMMPGRLSRRSLMIIAVMVLFIILLVALGLYAGIAGRMHSSQPPLPQQVSIYEPSELGGQFHPSLA